VSSLYTDAWTAVTPQMRPATLPATVPTTQRVEWFPKGRGSLDIRNLTFNAQDLMTECED
jgi:hypothetical protein